MKTPVITIGLLLAGCSRAPEPLPVAAEAWSNEAEALFQEAEVLRFTLQQQMREIQWQNELDQAARERHSPQASSNSDRTTAAVLPQTTKGVEP